MGNFAKRAGPKILAAMRAKAGKTDAPAPATASAQPTASWLLARHRADQGAGPAPVAPTAPATATTPTAPSGGSVLTDEELRRRQGVGIQLP